MGGTQSCSLVPDPSCQCLPGEETVLPSGTYPVCSGCHDFYPVDVSEWLIGFAVAISFIYFITPGFAYLFIRYYVTHSLQDVSKKMANNPSATVPTMPAPPPTYLTASDVSYEVPGPKRKGENTQERRILLSQMTACFRPCSLTCIMGPTGCGKSTTLNVLAGRTRGNGKVTGSIMLNGYKRDKYFKRASAYVEQFDSLFPYLTVRETLQYTAEFRLDVENKVKVARVEQVIRQLDLVTCADTIIGDDSNPSLKGISGGQRRRVAVGQELLTAPALLFLDEPTTGLDAFDSLTLVRILRRLANESGTTVISTINQPRPDIFSLFDNLILLVKGQVGYLGGIDEIPGYFSSLSLHIPEDANVADYIVDLTYDRGEGENDIVRMLVQEYQTSEIKKQRETEVLEVCSRTAGDIPGPVSEFYEQRRAELDAKANYRGSKLSQYYATYIHRQVGTLLRRSHRNSSRTSIVLQQFLIACAQMLFFGLQFLGIRLYSVPSFVDIGSFVVTGRAKASFMYSIINAVCLLEVDVIAEAFVEKQVFLREHASGAYSVVSYHLFWIIKLGWRGIRNGVIYSLLSYFLGGLQISLIQFFTFALVMCIMSTIGSALALILVVAIPDVRGAGDTHNIILGFMGTFAGFFLLPSLIPSFMLYYTYYLSFYQYAYHALVWNEFNYGPVYNSGQLSVEGDVSPGAAVDLASIFQVICNLNQWGNILLLLIYPIVFHAVALLLSALNTRPMSYWAENLTFKRGLRSSVTLDGA